MKNKFLFICLINFFIFESCCVFSQENTTVPYSITGKMIIEDSLEYEKAGFSGVMTNKSEKIIDDFTVVFYLFDEDGNSPLWGKNNVVIKVNKTVLPGEKMSFCISLDKFFSFYPEELYEVDYLYVSDITYEDKSKWSDPFGFMVF